MSTNQDIKNSNERTFEYKIFPWQNAEEVAPEHRNEILIATLFILPKGSTSYEDKKDQSKHIPIKTYPYQVINEEQRWYQMEESQKIYHHMPIQYYNHEMDVYENHMQFSHIEIQENFDDWINKVPIDEQVFQKFSKSQSVGCEHYIRGCQVRCETCLQYFPCRICHNSQVDDHQFPRFKTKMVKCNYCNEEQPISNQCVKCKKIFAKYYCQQCRLLCDIGKNNKPNYHCDQCGHCMVGLQKYTRHCTQCDGCINTFRFEQHKCVKMDGECIVCLQDLQETTFSAFVLQCNHIVHSHCYQQLLTKGILCCPICKKFLPIDHDRKIIIDYQKQNYDAFVIPLNYRQLIRIVQCNDCLEKFPQIQSDIKIYYCNKCKLYNCTVVQEAAKESDYKKYCESLPPDAIHQNLGTEEVVVGKLKQIWGTDDISTIENDLYISLTDIPEIFLVELTQVIDRYPKSKQQFLTYWKHRDYDDKEEEIDDE